MVHDKNNNSPKVRFIHNVMDAPAVSIFVDEKPIAYNLEYEDVTKYLAVNSGHRQVKMVISGTDTVLATSKLMLENNKNYTMVVMGSVKDLSTISVCMYVDDIKCPLAGHAKFRFIHGVYGAPNVDIYLNEHLELKNIKYMDVGTRAGVQVGKASERNYNNNYVNVDIKISGTEKTVIEQTPVLLFSGGIYTIIATGTVDKGISYLLCHDNPDMCDTLQDNLNAQNYMGKWYQIASIPQFYERGCARAVAEYTLLSDRINVVNYCYNEKWEKLISINGSAVSPNPAHPSALRVSFPNAPSSEMNYPGANYLIHKTDYERYAIVGSPTRSSFYILSREQKICERNYKDCLEYAKSLGYDITKVRPNHDSIEHNH